MKDVITKSSTPLAQWLLLSISAMGTIFTLGFVLWYCNYGFDITDEGFYLVWISNPFDYSASLSQFGYIYNPIYKLLDGNIAALRMTNILIIFISSWVLSYVLLNRISEKQKSNSIHIIINASAISMASLVFLNIWLPTPNYNSLALTSLLISGIGLLLAENNISHVSLTGWALIGASIWLAFMAKPSTAALLLLISVLYVLVAGKFRFTLIVASLAICTGLLIVSALYIDGSVISFIKRLNDGMISAKLMDGSHTYGQIIRLDEIHLDKKSKLLFFAVSSLTCFFVFLLNSNHRLIKSVGNVLIFAFLFTTVLYMVFARPLIHFSDFQGLLFGSIPLSAILIGFSLFGIKWFSQISREDWAIICCFAIFPYAYAFGTNNNYWVAGSTAMIFWVFAGLFFLRPVTMNSQKFINTLLPFSLIVQLISVPFVQAGIETPYRQPQPLRENSYETKIGRPGSNLILCQSFASYFYEVTSSAERADFKTKTPVIDLSGQSPGILYIMGARNVGAPWMIGGYPGSQTLAEYYLKKVS